MVSVSRWIVAQLVSIQLAVKKMKDREASNPKSLAVEGKESVVVCEMCVKVCIFAALKDGVKNTSRDPPTPKSGSLHSTLEKQGMERQGFHVQN